MSVRHAVHSEIPITMAMDSRRLGRHMMIAEAGSHDQATTPLTATSSHGGGRHRITHQAGTEWTTQPDLVIVTSV